MPGERVALPGGSSLRLLALLADSRCPPSVQCIQAGQARLLFELGSGARAHRFELSTAPPDDAATIDGHHLQLVSLTNSGPLRASVVVGSGPGH